MPRTITTPIPKLSADEQAQLAAILRKGRHGARVITRARIVSKLLKGHSHQDVCAALEVSLPTVLKTRKRLGEGGLQAALGELPRPGQKPKLDARQTAMVTAIACSTAPDGHDHWTLRLLSAKIVELGFAPSYSREGVRKLLKKTNSSPGKGSNGASHRSTRSLLPAWRM